MNRPTIKIKSSSGHTFSVDVNFLKKCPNPQMEDSYTLINTFKIVKYLHNLTEPALNGYGYYLLGEKMSKEEWRAKIFTNKLEDLLNE